MLREVFAFSREGDPDTDFEIHALENTARLPDEARRNGWIGLDRDDDCLDFPATSREIARLSGELCRDDQREQDRMQITALRRRSLSTREPGCRRTRRVSALR